MGRPRKRPRNLTILRQYAELAPYVQAFAQGKLNLLILIGAAGLEKSRLVRAAVGEDVLWFAGHVTPFQLYLDLYRHQEALVGIDDADNLTADRDGLLLLKGLCQTETPKTIAWHSAARRSI